MEHLRLAEPQSWQRRGIWPGQAPSGWRRLPFHKPLFRVLAGTFKKSASAQISVNLLTYPTQLSAVVYPVVVRQAAPGVYIISLTGPDGLPQHLRVVWE